VWLLLVVGGKGLVLGLVNEVCAAGEAQVDQEFSPWLSMYSQGENASSIFKYLPSTFTSFITRRLSELPTHT